MTSNTASPNAPHQPLAVDRPDPADHARAEILLNALERRGWCRTQKARLELEPVGAVVYPCARRLDELAGADRRRVSNDSDQVALASRLDTQDTEAVVGIVERDPLDQATQRLGAGGSWT
jgi:hypothetical protein